MRRFSIALGWSEKLTFKFQGRDFRLTGVAGVALRTGALPVPACHTASQGVHCGMKLFRLTRFVGRDLHVAAVLFLGALHAIGATHHVAIADIDFEPRELEIEAGDTVIWTHRGFIMHTTTSGLDGVHDGVWDSGSMRAGETFSFTFLTAGTFPYFCRPHASIQTGVIDVRQRIQLPRISAPEFRQDGLFAFTIEGMAGESYVVERSEDLIVWSRLGTVRNDTGTVLFTDEASADERRFYRVLIESAQ